MTYLKWVGNKTKLLPQIHNNLPSSFRDYYEPFCGSCAVYFSLREKDLFAENRSYYLSDSNWYLINTHKSIQNYLDQVIAYLKEMEKESPDAIYKSAKAAISCGRTGENINAALAAHFIFLNKRSYGGLFRLNSKGQYNVPFDPDQKSPLISPKLKMCSKLLSGANINCVDFCTYRQRAFTNDFVYLDPPYYPVSKTSNFTNYNGTSWKENDHSGLMEYLYFLDKSGVKFLMSNNKCEFIEKHCAKYNIVEVNATRYIDALKYNNGEKKLNRDVVKEVLVRNY